jgi:anti-sigma regulatory factor (Ser/Thr protein kinase)
MSPSPVRTDATFSDTEKAIRDFLSTRKSGLGRMVSSHFEIRTLEEAEKLSTMLATHCPMPEKVSTGIWELISNAVEHGNLEIDCREKAELIGKGLYAEELVKRLSSPKFAGRVVSVRFNRAKTRIRIRISDEGPGFDYSKYTQNGEMSEGPNGRGILIAREFSFDRIVYHGRGNVVDAIINV